MEFAPVAQWIEHWSSEPGVVRSNRTGCTKKMESAQLVLFLYPEPTLALLYTEFMDMKTGIWLKDYTTMRLGGPAEFMAVIETPEEARATVHNAKKRDLRWFVLGGGSNVVAHDEGFDGVVILNRIPGFEIIERTSGSVILKIGAGENWDEVVKRTVDMNLSGIEAMSGIPGTAGAAPVQTVGAYGQEIADVFTSLEAYDSQTDQFVTMNSEDCQFFYRDSIFRGSGKGRYIITSITLNLSTDPPTPPFYQAVQQYLDSRGFTESITAQTIRDAVLAIRFEKLPDPKERPNAGSFFKNALVEKWLYDNLAKEYDTIPHYDMPDNIVKIPTGWLIEHAGYKGRTLHGIHVHDKNALVLINESASSYADLAAARDEIISAVRDKFRIDIVQEPLEI